MSTVSYRSFTGSAAENYERYFVPAIATPVSVELLRTADVQPGERVLDVACGTGVVARRAAARVGPTGSVRAIDIAPEMIEVAKRVDGGSGVDWRVGDAGALADGDVSYDVVLCQMGLMFMEDRSKAVREMRRVLVPAGRLVVNTPGRIQPVFEHMEQAIVEHISPELGGFVRAVFSMHDPDAVATLLRDVGLGEVSATESAATLRLPAPAPFLWQYVNLTPMSTIVGQASEAAQTAMEEAFVDACRPYVTDGALVVEQPMVIATGRK